MGLWDRIDFLIVITIWMHSDIYQVELETYEKLNEKDTKDLKL